jgi:hypothetical protein
MKYKTIYVVIHGGELAFASVRRSDSLNYMEDLINSATNDVLNEWEIDDADFDDQFEAAYQAGFDGDSLECHRIDLSKYSPDESIIVDDDIELNYADITDALERSEYDDTTYF